MQKFKQLNEKQRYQIQSLLHTNATQTRIAMILNVHKSTISRELSRNTAKRGRGAFIYNSEIAIRKTKLRHKEKPKIIKFTDELKEQARQLLKHEKLSSELIAEKWKSKAIQGVSHETIYKWIWRAKSSKHKDLIDDNLLYKELRHGKRKRKRGNYKDSRGLIKNRTPISDRPPCVELRKRIGDIEVDLMMGAHHKSALLVMTDRATLMTGLEKLESKNATLVADKIMEKLSPFNDSWVKTLTFDNGKEFAEHEKVAEALNAKSYFTRPYTSQDKGTVENRIMSPINLSIDCVVLGFDEDQKLKVLLIKKFINEKNDFQFALPGDLVGINEDLLSGGKKILKSLTSLEDIYLKQFYTFGDPDRTKHKKDQSWLKMYRKKPEERVVTIGYIALVKMEDYVPHASSFAIDVEWIELDKVSSELAFDHNIILNYAIEYLREQLDHQIVTNLLPLKFTLYQLQNLYEILLDQKLDKRNFRKNVSKNSLIIKTDEKQKGVAHKPAHLYMYNK